MLHIRHRGYSYDTAYEYITWRKRSGKASQVYWTQVERVAARFNISRQ